MIEIGSLAKRFGDRTVLEDTSLSAPNGEILAVVGPSGAGKTTLSRFVSFLERPTGGTAAPPRYFGAAAMASHAARYRSSREYTPKALPLSRKPPPGPRVAVRMALAWSSER